MTVRAFAGLLVALVFCATAAAHHAGVMYDMAATVVIEKVEVKEWRWSNPHAWLQVYVTDAAGQKVTWSLESTSPNLLVRSGWRRTSMQPGDIVTVRFHPLKDGKPGGSLSGVILPDGTELAAQAGSGSVLPPAAAP